MLRSAWHLRCTSSFLKQNGGLAPGPIRTIYHFQVKQITLRVKSKQENLLLRRVNREDSESDEFICILCTLNTYYILNMNKSSINFQC